MLESILAFDKTAVYYVQAHWTNSFLDAIMPYITRLGSVGILWIVIALILICTKRYRHIGITMGVALFLGAMVGNVLIKPLIARARPSHVDPEMLRLISNPTSYSFPSGHTLSSFAAATSIFIYKKGVGTLALLMAALIAYSRIYLFVHYPTDLLVGMLIGVSVAIAAYFIVRFVAERVHFGGFSRRRI